MFKIFKIFFFLSLFIFISIYIIKERFHYNNLKISSIKIIVREFNLKNEKKITISKFLNFKEIKLKIVNFFKKKEYQNINYIKNFITLKISEYLKEEIKNLKLNDINFQKLIDYIKSSKIIENIHIKKTIKGNIYLFVYMRTPIARIIKGPKEQLYLDSNGYLFPTSLDYQFDVMTISFKVFNKRNNYINLNNCIENFDDYTKKFLIFLNFIENDKFLKSQISHLEINKNGFINIYTQISKQKIEYGQPIENIHKLKKFSLLYKKILPKTGWNKYLRVNLEYNKQIICE